MREPVSPAESNERYTDIAIALHWLLALAWLAAFGVGLYMVGLRLSPARVRLFNWHKWAGVSILVLSIARLAWRAWHRPPALPAGLGRTQAMAARGAHLAMYLLFFIVPLTGWAYSSAVGFPVVWFGRIPLPDFVPVDAGLAETFRRLHQLASYAIGALVVVHAGAALEHLLVRRDGVFARMIPARGHGATAPREARDA
jgi:cytochrome b561